VRRIENPKSRIAPAATGPSAKTRRRDDATTRDVEEARDGENVRKYEKI
jgi:hypothetical protein